MFNKSINVFIIKVVAAVISFLLNIVLVKVLGVNDSGVFFYFHTQVLFFSILATLGLQNLIVRESAIGLNRGDVIIKQVLTLIPRFSFFFSLMIFIVMFSFALFNEDYPINLGYSFLLCLSVLLYSFNIILCSINQGLGNFIFAVVFQTLFFNVFIVVSALLYSNDFSSTDAMYTYLFSLAIAFLVQSFSLYKHEEVKKCLFFEPNVNFKNILYLCFPFIVTLLADRTVILINQFVLDNNLGPQAISEFTIIARIVGVPVILLSSINVVLSKYISKNYKEGNILELKRISSKASRILIPASICFLISVYFFSDMILGVFGAEFLPLKTALLIASIGQAINLATGSVSTFLVMSGNEKLLRNNMCLSLFVVFVFIALNYSNFDVLYSSISLSIYLILSNMLSFFCVHRKLGVNTLKII